MEIPRCQPPVPVSVNKLLCHEFQSTAVCSAQDGQRDEIVSSFHRSSSAETTPVQLIQSFYRAGYIWSHLYSLGRKQIMFFTTTMSVSVTVSTSKRKTRPVLTMALFHSSEFPVQRLSPNKTLGETKGRACFTPGWAQPPLLQRQESISSPQLIIEQRAQRLEKGI